MTSDWLVLHGVDALCAHSEQWNQLWQASQAPQPTATAEGIACWCRHFQFGRDFQAIVATRDEKWMAAIPLLKRSRLGMSIFELPVNCWANAGDLLLHPDGTQDDLQQLQTGLKHACHGILRLEEIEFESARWSAFFQTLRDSGGITRTSRSAKVATISPLDDWEAYQAGWSSSHRRGIKRSIQKLNEEGGFEVQCIKNPHGAELEQLMRRCFEVEDLGWKGDAGTSVLKTPGMFEYFLDEASVMSARGELEIWVLCVDEQIIAFEYCHVAKHACFSHKLSFDPDYSRFGPGRLLRSYQLKRFFDDDQINLFDMLGTFCQTKAKWATNSYVAGTCVASLRSPVTTGLLRLYNLLKPPAESLEETSPVA